MSVCAHSYTDTHAPCPHAVAADSVLCLWHNKQVRKSDPYVRDLLKRVDAMTQGDLAGFHLAGVEWPKASLPLRNLAGADLRDTIFDDADLSGAELSHANLKRASLKRADLRGAQMTGVDLTNTNLTHADLRDADLRGAHISGTIFNGCDLRGANLADARIVDFTWNKRTRFAGVKGLDANAATATSGDDKTQAFPAPLALANLIDRDPSALSDSNEELNKTHVFAPITAEITAPTPLVTTGPLFVTPAAATTAADLNVREAKKSWTWRSVAASAAIAASLCIGITGASFGWWVWSRAHANAAVTASAILTTQPPEHLQREIANLQAQHEANLSEIMRLQEQARTNQETASKAKQDAEVSRALTDTTRRALRTAEQENARLSGIDDRATLLAQRVEQLTALNQEFARRSAKEESVGRILSDGVMRLESDKKQLIAQRDQYVIDHAHLAQVEKELTEARTELQLIGQERDALLARNQKLNTDLNAAADDLKRYLARVNATHLNDYLLDEKSQAPLLSISAGKPIALSGDYLLTLRIERGSQPGMVATHIVVQRPHHATNPDITVVLYNDKNQPLRRIAYSFPHVDQGRPFVASSTEVACEEFPSFARIQVTPGLDGLSAAR
jgi:uncharacterized protein YjbI with pentapeptide repeats